MDDLSKLPRDFYLTSMQFTQNAHHEAYPAVDPSLPEHSLAGKVAIVTGASRGIGALAMVPAFVKAGIKGIVLMATNASKLADTEKSIKEASPNVETLSCALDVSDTKAVESAFGKIKAKFGHADVLVNAAGAMSGDGPKLHETDPEAWWRNFEINGKGNYLLIRSFLALLPGPDTPATIVSLSSWQPFFTVPPLGAYLISKLVLDALATYVAAEYPNVNAISMHPGILRTDMLREPFGSLFNLDSPELVGGTTVWLCQEKAKFLSGRFIAANWDVQDLLSRKEEILEKDLLKLTLRGEFGV